MVKRKTDSQQHRSSRAESSHLALHAPSPTRHPVPPEFRYQTHFEIHGRLLPSRGRGHRAQSGIERLHIRHHPRAGHTGFGVRERAVSEGKALRTRTFDIVNDFLESRTVHHGHPFVLPPTPTYD